MEEPLDDVVQVVRRYLARSNGRPVVVELSGGLDTALVIEILRMAEANFALVGFASARWEFRTERCVQDHYAAGPNRTMLLPSESAPFFANLENTPLHVIPRVPSLFHSAHKVIAEAASSLGAEVVVSGEGGDALLCPPGGDRHDGMRGEHHSWGIVEPWPNDNVYAPMGMKYLSGFGVWPIPHIVWALRTGQGEDRQKRFARELFAARLPRSLSKFAYKADHAGEYQEGLLRAEPGIRTVGRSAYDVTKRAELHPDKLWSMATSFRTLTDEGRITLLLSLSFATWAHGFLREGIV